MASPAQDTVDRDGFLLDNFARGSKVSCSVHPGFDLHH